MKIFGTIFKIFVELIFARKEEYDFKSKHFKAGKVIFAGVVVSSFLMNFFLILALFRLSVQYVDLVDAYEKVILVGPPTPDKNQVKGSSDSSKPPIQTTPTP